MVQQQSILKVADNTGARELGELKTELFKLKFSLATNTLDNPMKIRDVKKDIARINTVLTERKIAEKKGVNE